MAVPKTDLSWDAPLVLTHNLFLQPLGPNSYAARASFASNLGVQLDAGTMALLSCFTEPRSPKQALAALGSTVATTEADFALALGQLLGHGLLRDARAAATDGAVVGGSGYGHAVTHHPLLLDAARVDAYRLALARLAPGRRVLEIGAGTGVLAIFAARYGAAEVVALEESGVIALARALAQENGQEDRITFVAGNSLDYRPEQRAEVIVHELIGHEPFAEHALRYLDDARARLLAPGGCLIPSALEVRCRAVGRHGWSDRHRTWREAEEVALRYGLSFAAYLQALAHTPPLPTFGRDCDPAPGGAVTDDATLYQVDFQRPIGEQGLTARVEQPVTVVRGGLINALVLHFRARLADDLWLSNAPEAPRTHWALAVYDLPEPIFVEAGRQLAICARLETIDGMERTLVELAT